MHSEVLGLQLLRARRDDDLQGRSRGLSYSGGSSTNVDPRLLHLGGPSETLMSVRTSTIFDLRLLEFASGARKNPKELAAGDLYDDWEVRDHLLGSLVATSVYSCRDYRSIYHPYVPQ